MSAAKLYLSGSYLDTAGIYPLTHWDMVIKVASLIRMGRFKEANFYLSLFKNPNESQLKNILMLKQAIAIYRFGLFHCSHALQEAKCYGDQLALIDPEDNNIQLNYALISLLKGDKTSALKHTENSIESCKNDYNAAINAVYYGLLTKDVKIIEEGYATAQTTNDRYTQAYAFWFKSMLIKDAQMLKYAVDRFAEMQCLPELQYIAKSSGRYT